MAGRDKCIKCVKVVKEGMQCAQCDCFVHGKCAGVTDELFEVVRDGNNLKWFCDGCVEVVCNIKLLIKSINVNHVEMVDKIERLNDCNNILKTELGDIKTIINVNDEKISKLNISDKKISDDMNNF